MFTWTNRAIAALALIGLTACADIGFTPPSRSVTVLGGEIRVVPPAGYCANPKVSIDGGDSTVVLIGPCAARSGSLPALITASIGAKGSGAVLDAGPVALTQFFKSDAGRAMLSSSGKPKDVVVIASESQIDTLMLAVNDTKLGPYWRAILAVKGRLIILSATSVDKVALTPKNGRALLVKAMASLRKANTGAGQNAAQPQANTPAAAPAPPNSVRPKPRPRVPTFE